MDNSSSAQQTPSGDPPASTSPEGGSSADPATHQDGPTGVSAVSDSVALLDGVASAYAGFDSTIHATDKDGKPVMLKGGGFARKRGRKAGASTPAAQPGTVGAPVTSAKMNNDMAAKIIVSNTEAFCMAIFGAEWEVANKEEALEMHKGVKNYLESTGGINISPGWGLLFTMGGYAVPRFKLPQTRSKLSRAFSWIKSKLKRGE